MKTNYFTKCCCALLAVIFAGCIAVLFPQVRRLVIQLAEQFIVRKPLQDHDKWMRLMFSAGSTIILCVCLELVIYFFGERISIFINRKSRLVTIWNSKLFVAICCGLLGAVFFIHTFGTAVLDFTYTDWLINGWIDNKLHYRGWCFYRNSAWHFLFGLMDNIVYPFKESIVYTDSIPLFALIFKVFSPLLPGNFQYFGLFGLIVCVLQGTFGGLIVKKITGNTMPALIGSMFFILSSSMLGVIFLETALSAHFIILLCIYACITKENMRSIPKKVCLWGGLFFLSATIQVYFVPMVGIFMLFDLLDDCLKTKKLLPSIFTGSISCLVLLITMVMFGAFYSHADVSVGGYGGFGANINSLFNPGGTSIYLKDLPIVADDFQQMVGQSEGISYTGLGIILGIVLVFVIIVRKIKQIQVWQKIIQRKTMLTVGLLLVFFLVSLGQVITLNNHIIFSYSIPGINMFFETFRAMGRMMRPVLYIIICLVVWRLIREYRGKTGIMILTTLLIIQYSEICYNTNIKGIPFRQRTEWKTELPSNVWDRLGKKYRHIVFLDSLKFERVETDNLSESHTDNMKLFSFHDIAIKHNLTINDTYLARTNSAQIRKHKEEEKRRIYNNEADKETIYVFESQEQAEPFAPYLHLYTIDDVVIGVKEPEEFL